MLYVPGGMIVPVRYARGPVKTMPAQHDVRMKKVVSVRVGPQADNDFVPKKINARIKPHFPIERTRRKQEMQRSEIRRGRPVQMLVSGKRKTCKPRQQSPLA